jgi:hypothetical protein
MDLSKPISKVRKTLLLSLSKKPLAFLTGFNNAKTFARQSRTKVIALLSSILASQGFRGI